MGERAERARVRFSTWFWATSKWKRYLLGLVLFLIITFLIAVVVGLITSDLNGKLGYWVWAGPISSLLFAFGFVEVPQRSRE